MIIDMFVFFLKQDVCNNFSKDSRPPQCVPLGYRTGKISFSVQAK